MLLPRRPRWSPSQSRTAPTRAVVAFTSRAALGLACVASTILATASTAAAAGVPAIAPKCRRDSLGEVWCPGGHQVVYLKQVDGHAVFAVCILGIALCLGWLYVNHKNRARVGGQGEPDNF